MRRIIGSFAVIVALCAVPGARAAEDCTPRLLVLSAFPGEIDGLITKASIAGHVVHDDRVFYVGTLQGNDVVLALTGIGEVNAEHVTNAALEAFSCGGITGIVFSGVSGGDRYIGDVTVPERWTLDDGVSWLPVDPTMLAAAAGVADSVALARETPVGDLACIGTDPSVARTVAVGRQPAVFVGGDGKTEDPFGGRRLPCIPGGGDVFGCEPCRAQVYHVPDLETFARDASSFVDPNFFFDYFSSPPTANPGYVAVDMETAAVAKVAHALSIPFIAFRALSDGLGDPLNLPGFPFQFFYYRQLAADNAASMTLAFLSAWSA